MEFMNAIRKIFKDSSYIYENNISCEEEGENTSISQADEDKVGIWFFKPAISNVSIDNHDIKDMK